MRGLAPFWLDPNDPHAEFPDVALALAEPDGLLAIGGDLSSQRLLDAYQKGIFPWYNPDQPILWWSPNPRAIIYPEKFKISRSLKKSIRHRGYQIRYDQDFRAVIEACSQARKMEPGTWITSAMKDAFCRLHRQGYAHSIECYLDNRLVGGLYGLAVGKVFFGESMFARKRDASKVAFAHLVHQLQQWNFKLIDCQVASDHILSLGAELIPRELFVRLLREFCNSANQVSWRQTITELSI